MQYLSVDFTLDGENDAQYHVDSTCGQDLSNTLTPLFWVDNDGDIRSTPNLSLGLPALCPVLDEESGRIMYPFGHLACHEDVMHALEVGQAIVSEIMSLDPAYCSYNT